MSDKELINIRWKETSGVDYAANNEKGWLVMKTADGSDLENLVEQLEEEERMQKNLRQLMGLLQSLSENDLPDNVQSAIGTVMDFLQAEADSERFDENKQAGEEEAESEEPKTNKSLIRKLLALLQKSEGTEESSEGEDETDGEDDAQKKYGVESDRKKKQTKKMLELMPAFLEKKKAIMLSNDELEVKKEKISMLLTEMQAQVMSEEADDIEDTNDDGDEAKVIKVHDRYFSPWEVADILRKFASTGTSPTATLNELNSADIEAVKAQLMEDLQRFSRSQEALDMLDSHMQSDA